MAQVHLAKACCFSRLKQQALIEEKKTNKVRKNNLRVKSFERPFLA
jgi:hypothetical protein